MVNEHFLKLCELRANWYMTSAATGHALQRNLQHHDGTPFTDQEKINDSVDIAKSHILLYQEHVDKYGH